MHMTTDQLVQQIHDSPARIVLAATGGGTRAIADLLEVPGGSRTLLEAIVPYSAPALAAFLGGPPDEACSAATASAMAMAAFHRARSYEDSGVLPAGVSCTAGLATDRPKRGEHRIHLALQTAAVTATWHLQLLKDRRSRAEEERLAGRLLLNVVAAACDVPDRLELDLLENEHVDQSRFEAPVAWQNLMLGKVESVLISHLSLEEGQGVRAAAANGSEPKRDASSNSLHPSPLPKGEGTSLPVIFPGAFNPLHAGHLRILQVAQELLGQPAAVEISILNVDKPPLDYMEIERRLAQFPSEQTVCLSRAATFEEKSRLFRGATFLVGADTLQRIAGIEYYGDSQSACKSAIDRIASRGCRFLVFGRDLGGGFLRFGDLELPDSLRALCREVPPEQFREDISSTALRKSAAR